MEVRIDESGENEAPAKVNSIPMAAAAYAKSCSIGANIYNPTSLHAQSRVGLRAVHVQCLEARVNRGCIKEQLRAGSIFHSASESW